MNVNITTFANRFMLVIIQFDSQANNSNIMNIPTTTRNIKMHVTAITVTVITVTVAALLLPVHMKGSKNICKD